MSPSMSHGLSAGGLSKLISVWFSLSFILLKLVPAASGFFPSSYQTYGCINVDEPLVEPGTRCKASVSSPPGYTDPTNDFDTVFTQEDAFKALNASPTKGDCSACSKPSAQAVCKTWTHTQDYYVEQHGKRIKVTAVFEWTAWYDAAELKGVPQFSMCHGTCSGASGAAC